MRIAITGPDGSGKTSVCNLLCKRINAGKVTYGGKREFQLFTTVIAYNLWSFLKKYGSLPNFVGLYFIYYPMEYIENCYRYGWPYNRVSTLVFDRHPIDRVMMFHENFYLHRKLGGSRAKYILEYMARFVVSRAYIWFFPGVDRIYILSPESSCFFERSDGQYKSLLHAEARSLSYKAAASEWRGSGNIVVLPFDKKCTVDELVNLIIADLGLLDG